MDTSKRKRELVNEFSPMIEKPHPMLKLWILVLTVIIAVGLYAFYLQFTQGHQITGMRDNVVWGIYIINFIFFVGLSYSGAFISGILPFFNTPWKSSVTRIVEIITVLSIIVGPIFILLCIGRLDRIYYLFMYPRIQSPITWDIIAIITDLVGCFIYLFLTFVPDFAILRDSTNLKVPNWRKKLYRFLAINYQDTDSQRQRLHKITRIMSTMVIAMAIVAYTVLAWIFSLTLQPGWNSTIFAPDFIFSGLYSGVAVIIIIMFLVRKYFKLEKYIVQSHFVMAGIVLLVLSLLFGYFTFSDYFAKWFSHKPADINLLNTLFGRYFWQFILANYIGVLVPLFILSIKKIRTIKSITFAAVIAVLGLWINRYLIVVPTLETPYVPIQDTRLEYLHYTATWIEWSLSFAGVAAFILFFLLIMRLVPIISMSETIQHERVQDSKQDESNKY